MCYYLLSAISCLCLLTGVHAEDCSPVVLAQRETLYVPAGGSLSLSCVVEHCGDTWTGRWTRPDSVETPSVMNHQTNVTLSVSQTRLVLDIMKAKPLDEGFYGCLVERSQGESVQGHFKYVNVTEAVSFQRTVLNRVLVCSSVFLCLPIILGLARCLSSKVKPQPLPRSRSTHSAVYRNQPHPAPQPPPRRPVPAKRSTSSGLHYTAVPKSSKKTEVVYADISQDALNQLGAAKMPEQSTVYSSLRFT